MSTDFHIIIPARMASSRLPGKLLLEFSGKTILEHVFLKALQVPAKSVTIATDDEQIFAVANGFGAAVLMTDKNHQSGTERVAEASRLLGIKSTDIIVNLQADEPQMPPELLVQVASMLQAEDNDWATLYWPIDNFADWQNPNVVKVVMTDNNQALYFSRSPIPYFRDYPLQLPQAYRHIGVYAYSNHSLQKFVQSPSNHLEQFECLEQLRALSLGMRIKLQKARSLPGQDINTAADFARLLQIT